MWVFLIFLPHPKLRNIFMTLQTFQEPSFTCITHDKLIYFLFILLHPCCCCCLVIKSCPTFATPWTIALHAPLPMRFPRQEYWHGLPFLSPGDLPYPGIKHTSPVSLALAGEFFITEPAGKPSNLFFLLIHTYICCCC